MFENMRAGVNLGGWLSQYRTYDHNHFQTFIREDDIRQIAGWGMDHVRLPVDYPVLESDEAPFQYLDSGLEYIENCMNWCKKAGLALVLDLHRAPGYSFDAHEGVNSLFQSATAQERLVALWKMLAARYKGEGDWLAFEMLNEIVLPDSAPWNALAPRIMQAIRSEDAQRVIVAGGNHYNSADQMANLRLPQDDRLVYTFHFYEPVLVTHQHAYWVPELIDLPFDIQYPSTVQNVHDLIGQTNHPMMKYLPDVMTLDADLLSSRLQPARDFKQQTGAVLYCGEFGVIDRAPIQANLNWTRDMVRLLKEMDVCYSYWSYKLMDFGLVDGDGKVVNEELVRILVG